MVTIQSEHFFNNIFAFTNMLRRAGIPVSLQQIIDFTRALEWVDIGNREQVYHAARCLLLNRYENMRLFDAIFNRFWRLHTEEKKGRGQKMPIAPRHKPEEFRKFNIATYMAYKARQSDQEIEIVDKSSTFSNTEVLRQKEFSEMTPEELETIKRLIQEMRWQVSLRKTRRWESDGKGDKLSLRQVMRSAAKYGGIPLRLRWQSKKIKQRPFVLIADVSGSMEKYSRLTLQFFYSVSHSLKDVECFVFGTRLTRITPQLKVKNIDRAIDESAHEIVDWAAGTRIGQSLKSFNQHWSRRVLRRGAIVLIISDGWERSDVSVLKQEMSYLQHRCHRLIWLNPLLGKQSYKPLVEGMAAALPYIDDFLPINNLQSMSELAEHLGRLNTQRSARQHSTVQQFKTTAPSLNKNPE